MLLGEPRERNLTGLFAWHEGRGDDQVLALVLAARPGLDRPGPFQLRDYEYVINIDHVAAINFGNREKRARFGGEVVHPESIRSRIRIVFHLDDDAGLEALALQLRVGEEHWQNLDSARIEAWAGVRDDPFIFPRFSWTNVIAMVLRLPLAELPAGIDSMLIWGESRQRGGAKIDHVGVSNRTQLARLGFLNTLEPADHMAALRRRFDKGARLEALAAGIAPPAGNLFAYVLQVRAYDLQPDVMVLDLTRPAGFPNGRRLDDDVAALTCVSGDCILQDFSHIDSRDWPRRTVSHRPFLDRMPYLARPWPHAVTDVSAPPYRKWMFIHFAVAFALLIGLLLFLWFFPVRRATQDEQEEA